MFQTANEMLNDLIILVFFCLIILAVRFFSFNVNPEMKIRFFQKTNTFPPLQKDEKKGIQTEQRTEEIKLIRLLFQGHIIN